MRSRINIAHKKRMALVSFFLLISGICSVQAANLDTLNLAKQITRSLAQISNNPKYSTVAFSRILGNLDKETVNDLIDFTENEIVQSKAFRVIDRSKLQLILKEQKFNLTGMVSSDTYKELGKLLGVDLFIYGRYYSDIIVLKAIDVNSSAIIWADIFQIGGLTRQSILIESLAGLMTQSLNKDLARLKANKISQISFWNVKSDFDSELVLDFLSVAVTKEGNFQVVDRENLQLILEEQKLNMEDFIDQDKAKKMGELYGVDAFIYGRIASKADTNIASLKLLNIYNGVIEWAQTIQFGDPSKKDTSAAADSNNGTESKMVYVAKGPFIMGSNKGEDISSPASSLLLNGFFIDRTEVSNQEYKEFTTKYRHRSPPSWPGGVIPGGMEDLPVVMVSWKDADRFCRVQGKRLPTEAEWEKAFRGENGRMYPWSGNDFDSSYTRTVESGDPTPVKVFTRNSDVSVYGVQHLAGNVREWVDSLLKPLSGSRYSSPKVGRERVIRGGSWATNAASAVGWYRSSSAEDYGWKDVGFRCAKSE